MSKVTYKKIIGNAVCIVGIAGLLSLNAMGQYYPPTSGGTTAPTGGGGTAAPTGGGGTPAPPTGGGMMGGTPAPTGGGMMGSTPAPTSGGSYPGPTGGGAAAAPTAGGAPGTKVFNSVYHVGFDRPEAWGLKYFAAATLLSGLELPEPSEGYRAGSVTVGLEMGWLPSLDAGQRRIGFNGTAPEDLNKAPLLLRPVVKIGLPNKFSIIAAAPPPFRSFGLTPRLFAFGVERPLLQRNQWTIGWRGYGQVGTIKGAFTCPTSSLAFAPGSPGNPTGCVGQSADVATLRYAGSEVQFSYRIPSMPKLVPHANVGGNFIDGVFQVHAPIQGAMSETKMWTHGGILSTSFGVTYQATKKAALGVDAFYSPLWVRRTPTSPLTNDGLFNVRALISYTFR